MISVFKAIDERGLLAAAKIRSNLARGGFGKGRALTIGAGGRRAKQVQNGGSAGSAGVDGGEAG